MKITLDELQVFISVVDCGSITAAAEQLRITISTTSRALLRLEEKVQTTLLYRTTRKIKLSEEGYAFLQKARDIIKLTQEAEDIVTVQQSVPSGKLRIDGATPFIIHVINPLIVPFHQLYPQIELEISNYEGYTDLLEKKTDIAFRIGTLKNSSLHATPIGYSQQRILTSPDYIHRHGEPKNIDELNQHCLLGFSEPDSLNIWPLRDKTEKGIKIEPDIAASSGEILCNLALKGAGIVCLSDFMTEESRQSGQLRQILPELTLNKKQAINAVYYRNQSLSPRVRCFIDFVKKNTTKIIRS